MKRTTIKNRLKPQRRNPALAPSVDPDIARIRGLQKHLEAGVLKAVVLVNPAAAHFDRVYQAVNIINAAQSYYRLELHLDRGEAIVESIHAEQAAGPIRTRVQQTYSGQLVFAMVGHTLQGGLTIDEAPGCTIISCSDWRGYDDAPAMRVYLVYQLTSALITFAACLNESENRSLFHGHSEGKGTKADDPRGCLFDFWTSTEMLFLSMVSARLCPRCGAALLAHGAPPASIAAAEKLLEWVRCVILGRERPLPQKVFIGHGRNSDWMALKTMLNQWGLAVEEFNEEPVAGVSISQRLKSMLEQSRFAFLVMTGEDKDDEGRLQARLNVVHEIGLFQGRLGTEYAVVLRRKDTGLFSNLDGINRLDFEPGKLGDLSGEIHRLLIARGVMPADVGKVAED